MTRFVLGILLCALTLPGVVLVMANGHWAKWISVVLAGTFTVSGTFFLALVTLGVLRRKGWLRWWQLVACGGLIGTLLPLLVQSLAATVRDAGGIADIRFDPLGASFFAAFGAIHAFALWAVAIVGNRWLRGEPREHPEDQGSVIPPL